MESTKRAGTDITAKFEPWQLKFPGDCLVDLADLSNSGVR